MAPLEPESGAAAKAGVEPGEEMEDRDRSVAGRLRRCRDDVTVRRQMARRDLADALGTPSGNGNQAIHDAAFGNTVSWRDGPGAAVAREVSEGSWTVSGSRY